MLLLLLVLGQFALPLGLALRLLLEQVFPQHPYSCMLGLGSLAEIELGAEGLEVLGGHVFTLNGVPVLLAPLGQLLGGDSLEVGRKVKECSLGGHDGGWLSSTSSGSSCSCSSCRCCGYTDASNTNSLFKVSALSAQTLDRLSLLQTTTLTIHSLVLDQCGGPVIPPSL